MTSLQGFFVPDIHVKANKELSMPDIFPSFKIIQVKWKSLLGEKNQEIIKNSLFNSPKLDILVQATREDLKVNTTNFRKFPKMTESDWE